VTHLIDFPKGIPAFAGTDYRPITGGSGVLNFLVGIDCFWMEKAEWCIQLSSMAWQRWLRTLPLLQPLFPLFHV
jgi:hypothetical protein